MVCGDTAKPSKKPGATWLFCNKSRVNVHPEKPSRPLWHMLHRVLTSSGHLDPAFLSLPQQPCFLNLFTPPQR